MLKNDYRTALVTGASSGIGEATVRKLSKNNIRVFALARRKERLDNLTKTTGCECIIMDIRNRNSVEKLKKMHFDILVNNAGIGRGFSKIFETSAEDIDTTIDTNVNSFLQLLRCTVPNMIKNKKGHIINIGSIAGLYPLSSSVYGGSKGAVHLINQNLRIELSGTGVRCTEINPGRVATEFFDIAFDNKKDSKKMTEGFHPLSPQDIANCIMYAIKSPPHVNISMIEITPTEQAPGGVCIEKFKG
ncbi:SDR family oxidoreductase [Alphaproteobacteria bacterium]|nr:SDR family oxidoreductase [Alphaproteobacteria bacterium]